MRWKRNFIKYTIRFKIASGGPECTYYFMFNKTAPSRRLDKLLKWFKRNVNFVIAFVIDVICNSFLFSWLFFALKNVAQTFWLNWNCYFFGIMFTLYEEKWIFHWKYLGWWLLYCNASNFFLSFTQLHHRRKKKLSNVEITNGGEKKNTQKAKSNLLFKRLTICFNLK